MKPVSEKIYTNAGNQPLLALLPEGSRRVLDLGCGAGDNARQLRARGIEVDGVTLSQSEADQAREHCRNIWVHNLELGLPAGVRQDYDCCIASHVFEHICWPQQSLRDLNRILAPTGGLLVMGIPNLLFVKNRLRLLTGNFDYAESGLMDNTHFRWYTYRTLRALLEEHGFKVEQATADGGLPLGPLRRLIPSGLLRWADTTSCRWFPGLFGYQFIFSARPQKISDGQ